MKLNEKIRNMEEDEKICVGSGSAFFYIGPARNFFKDIDEINDMQMKKTQKNLQSVTNQVEKYLETKPSVDEKYVEKYWDFDENVFKERTVPYEEIYAKWEKKYIKLSRTLERDKDFVDNFTNFETREIKEVYKNIDNDATIIIVEGKEQGRFWLKNEYRHYKDCGCIPEDEEEIDKEDEEYEYDEES